MVLESRSMQCQFTKATLLTHLQETGLLELVARILPYLVVLDSPMALTP